MIFTFSEFLLENKCEISNYIILWHIKEFLKDLMKWWRMEKWRQNRKVSRWSLYLNSPQTSDSANLKTHEQSKSEEEVRTQEGEQFNKNMNEMFHYSHWYVNMMLGKEFRYNLTGTDRPENRKHEKLKLKFTFQNPVKLSMAN